MAQKDTLRTFVRRTHPPKDSNWMTGDELIKQTGVSKKDLIRFIQRGIIPKSMMRLSWPDVDSSRKISYFSSAVIGHVTKLKRLRDKGHSVEEIMAELRSVEENDAPGQDPSIPKHLFGDQPPHKQLEVATPPHVHLPVGAITASAFFVNHDLRIGWIRVDRNDRLSAAIRDEIADDPFGTVFDIILRASLKELVFNWQPLFAFTYRFLQKTTAAYRFNRLAPTISLNMEETDPTQESGFGEAKKNLIDSCPINLVDKQDQIQSMRIYGIAITEGTLFVLDEEHWHDVIIDYSPGEIVAAASVAPESAPGKTPFSVISARLDDSHVIVDTLLPKTYYQLMQRIWDEADRIVTSHSGHLAKRSGTDIQYIIPQHADTDPAYDAICCAIELREAVRKIEASLRRELEWFYTIRLNMGISSGSDYLQEEDLTANMAFMLPGGAADQAFHLSTVAQGGSIWITKSAFSHLTPQQMKQITFGINRGDKMLRNLFAQVSDLPRRPGAPSPGREMESLAVTRIFAMHSDLEATDR